MALSGNERERPWTEFADAFGSEPPMIDRSPGTIRLRDFEGEEAESDERLELQVEFDCGNGPTIEVVEGYRLPSGKITFVVKPGWRKLRLLRWRPRP